jgi:hypothetical protein
VADAATKHHNQLIYKNNYIGTVPALQMPTFNNQELQIQAATAAASSGMPMPADMIANNQDDQPENQIADDDVVGEVIIGFDRLRRMSYTELRDVIEGRVALLENELRGREERRAAIDTANSASQILDFRRERAKRIHRQVNRGSAIAAIASTFLLLAIMV